MAKRVPVIDPALLGDPLEAALALCDSEIISMVREAIRHDEVLLAFQPITRARAPHDIIMHEALLRVLDPTGRVIPAKEFLGAIAHTELARQLDCLALRRCLRALAKHPKLFLSVNMSARSIGFGAWRDLLDKFLRRHPDIGPRLTLEITERSALELPELVTDFMDVTQAKGVSFALDDFGAALSSFSHFRNFFFDILKLDQQYAAQVHRESDTQIIARTIAQMAREFGMFTVATRVETQNDAAALRALGVDCLQGYVVAPPSISPPWVATEKKTNIA